LLWRTEAGTKMFSWPRFSPLLIEIAENNVPSVARVNDSRRIIISEVQPGPPLPKDHFYRFLVVKQGGYLVVQLNKLILWKCSMWLAQHIAVGRNESVLKTNYTRFRLGTESHGLLSIFSDVDKMTQCHHDIVGKQRSKEQKHVLEHEELVASAMVNQDRWPTDPNSLNVDLFKFSIEKENEMIAYMNAKDWMAVFGMAQNGYVTKHFLQHLVLLRSQIVHLRNTHKESGKTVALTLAGLPLNKK
jgi:hypothetical protein